MMYKLIVRCLLILGIAIPLRAHADSPLMRIEISNPASEQLDWLADNFEIVDRRGQRYDVIVPQSAFEQMPETITHIRVLDPDIHSQFKLQLYSNDYFQGYHTIASVGEKLQQLSAQYPEITRLETYGQSSSGRPLQALIVGEGVLAETSQDRQHVLLTSATHGDEIITVEVLLAYLEEVLGQYGHNDFVNRLLNQMVLVFVPVVSPDGYSRRQRYVQGIDPNRVFPIPQSVGILHDYFTDLYQYPGSRWPRYPNPRPRTPPSHSSTGNALPCIQKLMELADKYQIKGSLDLHASGRMVMYPWGYTKRAIANEQDRQKLDNLTRSMAEGSRYRHGPISKIIYVAKGSSADYFYWRHGAASVAVELGRSKAPRSSEISNVIAEGKPIIAKFLFHMLEM